MKDKKPQNVKLVKSCKHCNAFCCRYVTTGLDTPETKDDFEDIRWFVSHKNIIVFVDKEGDWYVQFLTPCKFLGKDNRCENYEKRPEICRKYNHDECEFYNGDEDQHTFETVKEVEKYMKDKKII